ncbi:hypothetical protein Cgig2_000832 [Carnegiea gigantea]|uniref:Uncharacterized protein n=1 Tax=Carnegiea gigantea TaxID=171969 RepID=A0A9Q1QJ49_9CARY|nr:hypothetical protein Cgig2_000832 [Carnegiea gigantea]
MREAQGSGTQSSVYPENRDSSEGPRQGWAVILTVDEGPPPSATGICCWTLPEVTQVTVLCKTGKEDLFVQAADNRQRREREETEDSIEHFPDGLHCREMVAYIANTLIFILSGTVIAQGVLSGNNIFDNHGIFLIIEILMICISNFAYIVKLVFLLLVISDIAYILLYFLFGQSVG